MTNLIQNTLLHNGSNTLLSGTITALITPFNNDSDRSVDFDSLAKLIEWQIEKKISAFVTCGTTGESATLSPEERLKVIRFTVEQTRKRVPVIAGTGSNNTRSSIELTRAAKELGIEAALVVSPYYNRPTQEGLLAHFSAVAQDGGLPVILYNIPGRTAVDIAFDTFRRLHQVPNIIGVKESSGSGDKLLDLATLIGPSFSVVSGDDSWTYLTLAVGGSGVISASSNAVPELMTAITSAADLPAALAAQLKALPAIRSLFLETNPVPVKTALRLRGIIRSDLPRLPLVPLRPDTLAQIEKLFQR